MQHRNRVGTQEQIDHAIALYGQGKSLREIGAVVGQGYYWVYDRLREAGVRMRRQGRRLGPKPRSALRGPIPVAPSKADDK